MQTVRELKQESHAMTYEQRKEAEQQVEQHRFGLALAAANALAGYLSTSLGTSAPWAVTRYPQEYGVDIIEVTNGHGIIRVHPGGYSREQRLCAFVPTTRSVCFGPSDYDTVRVNALDPTEATVNEAKDAVQVAKEFARKLGEVALNVADALDDEQAKMSTMRDKGAAVLNAFLRGGWHVSGSDTHATYVYVPVEHPLYRLGITALTVDPKTGGIAYASRPYPPHDITPDELLAVKF